jgi:hypothetical protein
MPEEPEHKKPEHGLGKGSSSGNAGDGIAPASIRRSKCAAARISESVRPGWRQPAATAACGEKTPRARSAPKSHRVWYRDEPRRIALRLRRKPESPGVH